MKNENMEASYTKSNRKIQIAFTKDSSSDSKHFSIKNINDSLTDFENNIKKQYENLFTKFDVTHNDKHKINYIRVAHGDNSSAAQLENFSRIYGYIVDALIDPLYKSTQEQDKLKMELDIESDNCKIMLNEIEWTGSNVVGNNWKVGKKVEFQAYIPYYYINCPKIPNYYYYMNTTYITENTPILNRIYFDIIFNKNKNTLTVKTIGNDPGEICTFEYVDITSEKTNAFSTNCNNENNCFYSSCNEFTFQNINTNVKAVKIRVLKHGIKDIDKYSDNVYICNKLYIIINIYLVSHYKNTQLSDDIVDLNVNLEHYKKNADGGNNDSASCTIKYWNIYSPLSSESERIDITNSSCSLASQTINLGNSVGVYDIHLSISVITGYSNVEKLFIKQKSVFIFI